MIFDLLLDGKNEFYPKLNTKKYYVLKADSPEKIKIMINLFQKFMNNKTSKRFLGIDFEFNKVSKESREVALMQINLENNTDEGWIILLYPPELKKEDLDVLIKLITQPLIIKILHGSESLDIPYLFNQLLITKKNIDNFCQNFYDTKYLCDYQNIEENNKKKCSIYDMLINNNIITEKKKMDLEKIEERTGPIYMVTIDIHNMSRDILEYSLYDVLYLPELIKKFIGKSPVYDIIIPEISCLLNKSKRNIELEFNKLDIFVKSANNFFIIENKNKILLKDIWEIFYYSVSCQNKFMEKLIEINYFKGLFETITKFFVYSYIQQNYKIYQNKNLIMKPILDQSFLKWMEYYPSFNKLIIEFRNNLKRSALNIFNH